MIGRSRLALGSMLAALVFAGGAHANGDATKGEKVFIQCKTCHSLEQKKNMVGPSLNGVVGRKAGMAEGYKYSDAMARSGLTWDEATLEKYLKNPRGVVPGTKMTFAGLRKDEDVDNVIAYLKAKAK